MATFKNDPTSTSEDSSLAGVPSAEDGGSAAATPDKGRRSTGDEMLDRVVQTAHETVDKLAHTAAPHVHHLQEGLHAVSDRASAQAATLRETGAEWTESLRGTVREHPLAALATALAVGILVARLTEPRR